MQYEKPTMQIKDVEIEDVIRTSGLTDGGSGDDWVPQ